MPPTAREQRNVSLTGFHDLKDRPALKMDLQRYEGRWYLYLAHFWHEGWSIIDVTNPTNPEYVRFVEGPENTLTCQIQVADGLMITGLERPTPFGHVDKPAPDPGGDYEESAYIWDVESAPTDPELIGHYERGGTGTHRNFYNGGDYAYMVVELPEFEGRVLEIVDVSDPANPERVSKWWWPGQHKDDRADSKVTAGFADFPRSYLHGPPYVRDDVAYLSYGRVGMVVLDVSDKTAPELMTRLDIGDLGGPIGVHSAIPLPDSDLIAVNDEGTSPQSPFHKEGNPLNFVFLVDGSDLSETRFEDHIFRGPRIASSLPIPQPEASEPYESYYEKPGWFGPHNQHHYRGEETRWKTNDRLIMTWFNAGLRIFDISNPLAPAEVGYYVPENPTNRVGEMPSGELTTQFEDVVVDSRGYIYCSNKNHGLFVFESDVI